MALTPELILNFSTLVAIMVLAYTLCCRYGAAAVLAVAAAMDAMVFWQELNYYESSTLFIMLIGVQLLVLAFFAHKSNKQ